MSASWLSFISYAGTVITTLELAALPAPVKVTEADVSAQTAQDAAELKQTAKEGAAEGDLSTAGDAALLCFTTVGAVVMILAVLPLYRL